MDQDRVERIQRAFGDNPHKRRLIVYAVFFVLLLAWVGVSIFRAAQVSEGPEVAPPDEAVPRGIRETLARVDPARLAGVRDGSELERAVLERDAAAHLLEQAGKLVWGDLEQLGLQPADRDALEADPAAFRGRPLWVIGTLQWQEPLQDDVLGACVQGELRDQQDRPWNFLSLAQLQDVRTGEVARASGFFLKHWDLLRPDGSRSSGPLLVCEEVLRSAFRIAPVTELDPDLFLRVRDFDLQDASQPLESPEFFQLLSYVQSAPPGVLFAERDPPPEIRPDALMRDTGEWRGEPVRVSGRLLLAREIPLGPRGENPLGVPVAWDLWLSSYQGVSRVISLQPPEGLEELRDIVDADGLYFRRYAYENTRDMPRMAAVVVASRLQRFVPPENQWLPTAIRIMVGLAAGGAVLFFLLARSDRKAAALARQASIARKKKLVARPGLLHPLRGAGEGPATPPGAGPPADGGAPPPTAP
ncbi:MAG: hypothetical protein FJ296_11000, partial [Planctomycetes bacterium]|nr:hypothetical protein [Planctomycetota bacterium]